MSSLPDSACPPLSTPARAAPATVPPPLSRSSRTWYFIGTLLFGVGVFAVQLLAQIATFIGAFIWSGAPPAQTPEEVRALIHNGGWLALSVIMACPFVLGALWIPIKIARQRFSDYLALRWPNRAEVFGGLAMLTALLAVFDLLRHAFGQATPEFMIETYRSARDGGFLAAYVIGLCVAGPIAEEFLVRGFLFRGWSKSFLGTAGAIVLSSAVWAALHTQYNVFYMLQIFALGILLGILRQRSGSTWLTVILHAANNAVAVAHVALMVP